MWRCSISVSDGEKAQASVFNSSFISREVDSGTVAKIDLADPDTDSQTDVQSNMNGLQSFTGAARNGSPTQKPSFTTDNIGASGDDLFERTDAVQAQVEANTTNVASNTAESLAIRNTTGTTTSDTDMGSYTAGTNGFNLTASQSTKQNIQGLIDGVDERILLTEKGAANGVATLDASSRLPASQLPTSATEYKGAWDASTNTPTLADGVGTNGDLYRVSVAGTIDLGSGSETYGVGDAVIYNGTIWQKIPADDAVTSVNGQSGIVALTTTDIPEGTNEYYTNAKADARIAAASIDALSDVDTTTVAPTEGQALVYDSVGGEWVPGDAGSGSGAGSKTYFADGDFENNIDDASVYDDSGSYVDGTGGSPTALSIAATATALAGDQSLEISKAASDATGEGVTLTTQTIDEIDLGKELFFRFAVDATDANYTTDDILIKAYDVTNSVILSVTSLSNLSVNGGLINTQSTVVGKVLTNPTTAEVRLSLHVETDSNTGSTWDIRLDEARIGPDGDVLVIDNGPVGEIIALGDTTAPDDFLYCDGSSVSRTTYAALFAVIGTAYGTADGASFNLPDLRGQFLRGQDDGQGVDPDAGSRTAAATGGNTGDNVGSVQDDAFESHNHTVDFTSSGAAGALQAPGGVFPSGVSGSTGGNETRPKNTYVRYYIRYQNTTNSVVSVGVFEVLDVLSSSTAAVTSGVRVSLTGNGVSLSPGTWELDSHYTFFRNGGTSNATGFSAEWSGAQNAFVDVSTLSGATIDYRFGNTVASISFNTTPQIDGFSGKGGKLIVTLTEPQTMYVNSIITAGTPANFTTQVGVSAKRLR